MTEGMNELKGCCGGFKFVTLLSEYLRLDGVVLVMGDNGDILY